MVTQPRRITFADFAKELDAVFDDIAEHQQPVLVERAGKFYLLEPISAQEPGDIWADYDPEAVLQAFRAARAARLFEGVDTEALKAELKAARGQDSQGRPSD